MKKIPCKDSHYWMDGIIHSNLEIAKRVIRDDWDYLYVIDGGVGTGKSVFAQQLAYFAADGKFTADQICFTPDEFEAAILKAPRYSAVVFDEAFRGLSGRASMSKTNKALVELLNEIRQKNLFVFIVLPSMWDLDKFVTMHRCKGVFHVHTVKRKTETDVKIQRGYVRYYKGVNIRYFIGNSKNRYVYPKEHTFHSTFRDFYTVDEEEYKKKKSNSLGASKKKEKRSCLNCRKNLDRVRTVSMEVMRETGWSRRKLSEKTGLGREFLRKLTATPTDSIYFNPQEPSEVNG